MKKTIVFSIMMVMTSLAFAQKKTVKDYYTHLLPKLQSISSQPAGALEITKTDLANGFMSFKAIPEGMGTSQWQMALFRAKNGREYVAVFEYGCGGLGCAGSLNSFKIFDYDGNDITKSLVDLNVINQYFKSKKGYANENYFENSVSGSIPQHGTIIKLQPNAAMIAPTQAGVKNLPVVELQYVYADGTFRIVKK